VLRDRFLFDNVNEYLSVIHGDPLLTFKVKIIDDFCFFMVVPDSIHFVSSPLPLFFMGE